MQTEDYARSVIEAGALLETADVDRLVAIRLARQRVLDDPEPPRLWAIIGEAALRQIIGGREVMRRQLGELAEISTHTNVMIQVLPFSVGAYIGTSGSFVILDLSGIMFTVVSVENLTSSLWVEEPADVARYNLAFDHLRTAALPPGQSRTLIRRVIAEL